MSVVRTADEKPITLRGWLWLLLYALGVVVGLRACLYVRPAKAALIEKITILRGNQHFTYCGVLGPPTYVQVGLGAEVRCVSEGGAAYKVQVLRCQDPKAKVTLAGFGNDPSGGPFFRTACEAEVHP